MKTDTIKTKVSRTLSHLSEASEVYSLVVVATLYHVMCSTHAYKMASNSKAAAGSALYIALRDIGKPSRFYSIVDLRAQKCSCFVLKHIGIYGVSVPSLHRESTDSLIL